MTHYTPLKTSTLTLSLILSSLILVPISALSQVNLKGEPFPKVDVKKNREAIEKKIKGRIDQIQTKRPSQVQGSQTAQSNTTQTSSGDISIGELLGDKKEAVARWYGTTGREFDKLSSKDKCLKLDNEGKLYHACGDLKTSETPILQPNHGLTTLSRALKNLSINTNSVNAPIALNNPQPQNTVGSFNPFSTPSSIGPVNTISVTNTIIGVTNIPTSMAFELESLPGAKRTIYLDFDGHISTQTGWNGLQRPIIDSLAMDLDSTPDAITEFERRAIINMWLHVLEDYAPFEVNITTKEPPLDKLIKSNFQDQEYGIRVVIQRNNVPLVPSVGGIAMFGSFTWNTDTPCFVFSSNLSRSPKYIAETISHEVGHTLGLHHDGLGSAAYHYGTGDWAPIMGVSFYRPISQWSKGDYTGANNTEDDIAKIAQLLPLKQEQEEARELIGGSDNKTINGVIGGLNDKDIFIIDAKRSQITLQSLRAPIFPNLNFSYNIYNEKGNLVQSLPAASFNQTNAPTISLDRGRYYVEIAGAPVQEAGGSYGSVGYYQLSLTHSNPQPDITHAELDKVNIARVGATINVINTLTEGTSENSSGFKLNYQWEQNNISNTNQNPQNSQNFQAIAGATNPSLVIPKELLGKEIRALVRVESNSNLSKPLATRSVKISSPNIIRVSKGENFSFGSQILLKRENSLSREIIINEISRGLVGSNACEWLELLVLKDTNLKGYSISSGTNRLTFNNTNLWELIPTGTTIVVYNGDQKDPLISPDKFNPHTEKEIIVSSKDPKFFSGRWPAINKDTSVPTYKTGFEDGSKSSYALGNPPTKVNFSGFNFLLDDALVGTETGDIKEGTKSIRMRNGSLTMDGYFSEPIESISFQYSRANFTGDRTGTSPKFVIESRNQTNPNSWTQIGQEIDLAGVNSLTNITIPIKLPEGSGLRLRKTSGTRDKRWNIDNLTIMPQNGGTIIVANSKNIPLVSLGFDGHASQIKPNFLNAGQSESFINSNPDTLSLANSWNSKSWSKPTIANSQGLQSISFNLSPGLGNSTENTSFINSLRSPNYGVSPTYSIVTTPNNSEFQLDPISGVGVGRINEVGLHKLQLSVSNGQETLTEVLEVQVTQSFKEKLQELGLPWDDLTKDIGAEDSDNDEYTNLLEYVLGQSPHEYGIENKMYAGFEKVGAKDYVTMTYELNSLTEGLDIIAESSSDLKTWTTAGVEVTILSSNAQSGLQVVKARKELPSSSPKRLFLRLRLTPTSPELVQRGIKEQYTTPMGVSELQIAGTRGTTRIVNQISIPLLGRNQFTPRIGTVDSIPDAGTIKAKGSLGTHLPYWKSKEKYAILMTSGLAKGQMFLLMDFHPDGIHLWIRDPYHKNLDMRTSGVKPGDTFRVYTVPTIISFFGKPSDGFVKGDVSHLQADLLKTTIDGRETTYYYNTNVQRWVNISNVDTSVDNDSIHPYYGLTYEKLGIGGSFLCIGEVPNIVRATKVKDSGITRLSPYHPIDQRLANLKLERTEGWVASTNSQLADKVTLVTPSGSIISGYHDGTNWRDLASGNTSINNTFVRSTSNLLLQKSKPDSREFSIYQQEINY